MPINMKTITKEMLEKAMQCKSADELIAFEKAGGVELNEETLKKSQAVFAGPISDRGQLRAPLLRIGRLGKL